MTNRSRFCVLLAGAALACVSESASAEVITYMFDMNVPGGNSVENLVFFAAGQGLDDISVSTQTISPTGFNTLTHSVGFDVSSALVVGTNVGPDKNHIIMFTNDAFAQSAVGYKWSELFTAPSPRHNEFITYLEGAHAGDAASIASVSAFLRSDQAALAAFDPHGSYSVLEFSTVVPPIGTDLPEPASLAIVGLGAMALCARRRRRW